MNSGEDKKNKLVTKMKKVLDNLDNKYIRLIEDFESLDVMIRVPLSQLVDNELIDEVDKPRIFSVVIRWVVCQKVKISEDLEIFEFRPVAILDMRDERPSFNSYLVKKYAIKSGLRILKDINKSTLESLNRSLSTPTFAITNISESHLGFITRAATRNSTFIVLHEVLISEIIELISQTSANQMQKSLWRNSAVDILIVCRATGMPLCVVEFDGPHHNQSRQKEKDETRDLMMLEAGIPTIRFKANDLFFWDQEFHGYKFSPDIFRLKFVLFLLEQISIEIEEQRILQEDFYSRIYKYENNIDGLDFDYIYYVAESVWANKSNFNSLGNHLDGGLLSEYSKVFFERGIVEPKFEVEVINDVISVKLISPMNNESFRVTIPVKGNLGYLGVWRLFYKNRNLFKDIAIDCIKLLLIDEYCVSNGIKFFDGENDFHSPLRARLELRNTEARDRYLKVVREDKEKALDVLNEKLHAKFRLIK